MQTTLAQLDFSLGISRDRAPHEIDPRAVWDAINALVDKQGSMYKRGGTANFTTADFGSAGLRWVDDRFMDAGQRTIFASPDNFGVADADGTPIDLGGDGLHHCVASALLNGKLFIGGGYLYGGSRKAVPYSTGTAEIEVSSDEVIGTGTAWSTNVDPGMLFQITNGASYPIAEVIDDTHLRLRNGYFGPPFAPTDPVGTVLTGQTYALEAVHELASTDPYMSSAGYNVCANRLIAFAENNLYFSEINNPQRWTTNIDGNQIPNVHELPEGSEIVATVTVGQTLLILTTFGIWTLDGLAFEIVDSTGNPQHTLRILSRELLPWGDCVSYWDQAAVIPTLEGIFLVDGQRRAERVSRPIDVLYRQYVAAGYIPGQGEVHRGHFFLPILSANHDEIRDTLVCRLDHPVSAGGETTYPWTRLSGAGANVSCYVNRTSEEGGDPQLLGAELGSSSRVIDATSYFEPDADHSRDAQGNGFTNFDWLVDTRDFETGDLTRNMVRYVRPRVELVDPDTATPLTPAIHVFVGEGLRNATPGPYYFDQYNFGDVADDPEDLYFPDEENTFEQLHCVMRPNEGIDGLRCRVGPPSHRYVRLRLTNAAPCSLLRLRAIELFIRPSQTRRR